MNIKVSFVSDRYMPPAGEWDAVSVVPRIGDKMRLPVFEDRSGNMYGEDLFKVTHVVWSSPTSVELFMEEVEE